MSLKSKAIVFVALSLTSANVSSEAQEGRPSGNGPRVKALQAASEFATIKINKAAAGNEGRICRLIFQMEPQEHGEWCWAATTKSISFFYSRSSKWSQCLVASKVVNTAKQNQFCPAPNHDCCNSYSDTTCNFCGYLHNALSTSDNYQSNIPCASNGSPCGALDFDLVVGEIELGHPVGIRVGWWDEIKKNRDSGHFLAIVGYAKGAAGNFYYVDDPKYGPQTVPESKLNGGSYQYIGKWTHAYYTQPTSGQLIDLEQKLICNNATLNTALLKSRAKITPVGFKFEPVDERLTELAVKARPFVFRDQVEGKGVTDTQVKLAVPHKVYVMDLGQLTEADVSLPLTPSGTRVLDMADGQVLATYDFKIYDGEAPELIGAQKSPASFQNLSKGLQTAFVLSNRTSETPELRLLTIPALYFEALWVHYTDPNKDMFVPTLSETPLVNEPIAAKTLLETLHTLARTRLERRGQDNSGQSAP